MNFPPPKNLASYRTSRYLNTCGIEILMASMHYKTSFTICVHDMKLYKAWNSSTCLPYSLHLFLVFFVVLLIDHTSITYHPYNGQIFINSTILRDGTILNVLYIHLDGKSLPICVNENAYNSQSFDSMCRQLGYTEHVGVVSQTSPQ